MIPLNIYLVSSFSFFSSESKFDSVFSSKLIKEEVLGKKRKVNKPILSEEQKINIDTLKDLFNNKNVYLDANIFDSVNPAENIELIVGITDANSRYNLHNYSKRRLKNIEKESIKDYTNYNLTEHDIYSNNDYKYIRLYYEDKFVYIIDYNTVINGKTYTIKCQKGTEFNDTDKKNLEHIIDTIKYEYKEEYEVKPPLLEPIERIIVWGVIGGLIGGVTSLIMRRKMNR